MGSAHARRLNLIALVVLLVALAAGTGLRIHAQRATPNVQHDEAWSVRERCRPARAVRRRHGRRPRARASPAAGCPRAEWQRFWTSRASPTSSTSPPASRPGTCTRRSTSACCTAWLLATGMHVWAGRALNLVFAAVHHPRHLRAGARPGVRAAGGRAGRARLGGEPRGGEHLVHHPPVRPRRPHHRAAGVGPRRRGEGAPGRAARWPYLVWARRRDRRGAADPLPGRAAGGRRGGLRARRALPARTRGVRRGTGGRRSWRFSRAAVAAALLAPGWRQAFGHERVASSRASPSAS